MIKHLAILALLLFVPAASFAAPFAGGNADDGKTAFAKHKCASCHSKQFGGDGSNIFTRKDRKIKNASGLSTQIRTCSTNLGLMMFEDEEENIAAYLNKAYYKFK